MTEVDYVAQSAELIPGFIYVYELTEAGERFLYVSAAIEEILGVSPDEACADASKCWRRLHPDDISLVQQSILQATAEFQEWDCVFRILHPDRGLIWLHGRARPQRVPGGVRWYGFHHDVTRAQQAEAALKHAALHDALTGLPNRRGLEQVLESRAAHAQGLAALHLDLDRFKSVIDANGHAAGDVLLQQVAALFRRTIDAQDFLARVGGDEFVVVPAETPDRDALKALAERLIDVIAHTPIWDGDRRLWVGLSVGAALRSAQPIDPRGLLADADIALYRAKRAGGDRVEFFSEAVRAEIVERRNTTDQIRAGLASGEFKPFYQPQICARSGAVVGVEALARWLRPGQRPATPDRFIDVAEQANLLPDIDRRILQSAHQDMLKLRADGWPLRLSVNVSAGRLCDPGLIAEVAEIGPEPSTLCFELLESIFLEGEDDLGVTDTVASLRELGVEIELDDFGSGHASIMGLMRLRPQRLKIDRRLVQPMLDSAEERALVESILAIGRALNVSAVAEGVETLGHAAALNAMGCELLQGYAFARPVSIDELRELLVAPPWLATCASAEVAARSFGAGPVFAP